MKKDGITMSNQWKPDLIVGTCEGFLFQSDKLVSVMLVRNDEEGNGDFGKWVKELEKLAKGKRLIFPTPSLRCAVHLMKHGYVPKEEMGKDLMEKCLIMEKILRGQTQQKVI